MHVSIADLEQVQDDFRLRISLDIPSGECLAVLGPSGSGKSTLLRAIAGLLPIQSGTIHLGGRNVAALPPEARGLGLVFQDYALLPHLSVLGNVSYPLRLRKLPQWRERSMAMMERCGIAALAPRMPATLSGGERQRCALARALVHEPGLVLLDEPLSALDRELRLHLRREIRELLHGVGATALYVTHDQEEALSLGDRIAVLANGELVECGSGEQLYREPRHFFTACFLGEYSLLQGRGGEQIHLRPEDVFVCDSARGIPARVHSAEYRGREWLVQAHTEHGELLYLSPACPAFGSLVRLDAHGARIFHDGSGETRFAGTLPGGLSALVG